MATMILQYTPPPPMEKTVMPRICMSLAASLLALSCAAWRQAAYPTKPIRLVLPFPPGAPSGIIGRALGNKLAEQLGVAVVADNRVGAGGNIGLSIVAKALPDGYTLVVTTPAIALSPSRYAKIIDKAGLKKE